MRSYMYLYPITPNNILHHTEWSYLYSTLFIKLDAFTAAREKHVSLPLSENVNVAIYGRRVMSFVTVGTSSSSTGAWVIVVERLHYVNTPHDHKLLYQNTCICGFGAIAGYNQAEARVQAMVPHSMKNRKVTAVILAAPRHRGPGVFLMIKEMTAAQAANIVADAAKDMDVQEDAGAAL